LYGGNRFDVLANAYLFGNSAGPKTFASWPSRLRVCGFLFPAQFPQQPRLGHFPVALGGLGGNSQDFGCLLHAQAAEVAQLHDPAFAGIEDVEAASQCTV
jgi:hypothetical protein